MFLMHSLRVQGINTSMLRDFETFWKDPVPRTGVWSRERRLGHASRLLSYKRKTKKAQPQYLISATSLTWADLMSWERAQWSSASNRDPGGSCGCWPAMTYDPDAEDDDWVSGFWVTSFVVCKAGLMRTPSQGHVRSVCPDTGQHMGFVRRARWDCYLHTRHSFGRTTMTLFPSSIDFLRATENNQEQQWVT